MSCKTVNWIWGLILLFALGGAGYAQLNRGIMEGIVTDPSGAFVAGAKVVVTAMDTGVKLPTITNSAGYYRVEGLVPGKYAVSVEASGFSSLNITAIEVPAGQTIRTDAQLVLGVTRQVVDVTSKLSMLQTATTNFSTDVGTTAIQDIPLAGRDLQQLVFLVPGVVGNGPPGSSFGFNSEYGTFPDPTHYLGSSVSINGGQAGFNSWYLDGNTNLSGQLESVVVNPSPDAVSEFQAVTTAFSAEYGRSGGAVFSQVLKSGTNRLHGDVYEYVRNSYFNARNPFTSIEPNGQIIPQDQLRYNNFGGTLGGPVVIPHLYNGRDKTFFFFSWDESILHLNGSSVFTVPTPSMRAGDFSEDPSAVQYGIWDPSTTVGPDAQGLFQRTALGTPASGYPNGCLNTVVEMNPGVTTCNFATQLPTVSKTAAFFMNQFPLPNYLNPLSNAPLANGGAYRIASNYLTGLGSSQDGANISLKVDHQWSEKNRYFGEWLFNPGKYNNYRLPWTGGTLPSVGFGGLTPFDFANQIIALGNTYTPSPTLVNEFRASFSRQYYNSHPSTGGYPASVTNLAAVEQALAPDEIPVTPPVTVPTWYVSTPAGGSLSWGAIPWYNNSIATESYNFLDNVTKLLGKHTLRTGFEYRLSHAAEYTESPTYLGWYGGGGTDPATGEGEGSGLSQFLLGDVLDDGNSYASTYWQPYVRWRYWGLYLQDDYRITPNFTLNLGLRYDINGAYKSRQHPDSKFCLSCPNSYTGLPGLMLYEGDPGFPMNSDVFSPNWHDFGPRINFSWSPFSDRKTVIRGGYDIFYSNAYSTLNSGAVIMNQPGYSSNYLWTGSSNPAQCANFSAHCVAFNLDSPGDKGAVAIPPFSTAFPGTQKSQLYTTGVNSLEAVPKDPMVETWTLQVQRQLPGNVAVTVGYVGSHGTHTNGPSYYTYGHISTADKLKYTTTINNVVPITDYYSGQTATALQQVWGAASLSRTQLLYGYPFWPVIVSADKFDGENVYQALQIRVDKKLSQGLNFTAAFTGSKNIATAQLASTTYDAIDAIHAGRTGYVGGLIGALNVSGENYQDPDNIRGDRALAYNDTPRMLNIAATYQLPFGTGMSFLNRKGPLNLLIGGWRLTGNFNAESGVPLSISGPCNGLTCRPDLVGNPKAVPGGQNAKDWINAAAFTPPFGSDQTFWANPVTTDNRWWQFGTAGLRLPGLRSPGFWTVDSSLAKEFHVSESKYFELRWEMFNALNHQNLGLPNTNYCLPPQPDGSTDLVHQAGCSFGLITNVQTDPRAMEFALKFIW